MIPRLEKTHLDISKPQGLILGKSISYGGQNTADTSVLSIDVSSCKVGIDGLVPAEIIVRVGHDMDCESLILVFTIKTLFSFNFTAIFDDFSF